MRRSLLALPLILAACGAVPTEPPVRTVAAVELPRYLGKWYEVARYPNRFEDGSGLNCAETTAEYALRPDGRIRVVNTCRNAAAGDAVRVAEGQAYAVEGSGNAKLRVSFFWPFYGNYWVMGLSPDYRWAVVGAPGRDYLWVLSRTPAMAPADWAEAQRIIREQGFDPARITMTRQNPR